MVGESYSILKNNQFILLSTWKWQPFEKTVLFIDFTMVTVKNKSVRGRKFQKA